MNNLEYYIWLSEVISKGSNTINKILEDFDDISEFYGACQKDVASVNHLSPLERKTIKETPISIAKEIISDCEKSKIKIVCVEDDDYPQSLRNIYAIPPVLYYYGSLEKVNNTAGIAIVGTRKATDAGKMVTANLAFSLAMSGITVVSGCAIGIDEFAHKGAIKAGGTTYAVLACSVDHNYPKENAKLKKAILNSGGALISEIAPKRNKINPSYIPKRNRIITGMAECTLLTEVPARSGASTSAQHALDQGKEVFCTPPLVYGSSKFDGVIKFLRSGAIPVYDVADILIEYYMRYAHKIDVEKAVEIIEEKKSQITAQIEVKEAKEKDSEEKPPEKKIPDKPKLENVSENAEKVYNAMTLDPMSIDELIEVTDITVGVLLATLSELELAGVVKFVAGRRYALVRD